MTQASIAENKTIMGYFFISNNFVVEKLTRYSSKMFSDQQISQSINPGPFISAISHACIYKSS
jgi:hypothetical protein